MCVTAGGHLSPTALVLTVSFGSMAEGERAGSGEAPSGSCQQAWEEGALGGERRVPSPTPGHPQECSSSLCSSQRGGPRCTEQPAERSRVSSY